jgi:hypothetical protein
MVYPDAKITGYLFRIPSAALPDKVISLLENFI